MHASCKLFGGLSCTLYRTVFMFYRLHNKVYLLSTEQAMKAFMYNPARYLLPYLPEAQCKVLVVGNQKLGQTYIAEAIATFFQAYVCLLQTYFS